MWSARTDPATAVNIEEMSASCHMGSGQHRRTITAFCSRAITAGHRLCWVELAPAECLLLAGKRLCHAPG